MRLRGTRCSHSGRQPLPAVRVEGAFAIRPISTRASVASVAWATGEGQREQGSGRPVGHVGHREAAGEQGLTFWARARAGASMTGGRVLGMAHTMVTPPARAAAVPEAKSSLCVPPGSRRCTWTSISPARTRGQKISRAMQGHQGGELGWQENKQPLVQGRGSELPQSRASWMEEYKSSEEGRFWGLPVYSPGPSLSTPRVCASSSVWKPGPPTRCTYQAAAQASGRSCSQRAPSKEGPARSVPGPADANHGQL